MGWVTEYGEHEGWDAAEFTGNRFSFGSTGGGAMVKRRDPATGRWESYDPGDPEVVDGREAIGWRGLCECGWTGPLWQRVATPAEHDPDDRRIYDGEPRLTESGRTDGRIWGGPPPQVEEAIFAEWRAHVKPLTALDAVREQAAGVTAAQARLTEAVRAARQAGSSWTDIGRAVGISRQSAHERWAGLDLTWAWQCRACGQGSGGYNPRPRTDADHVECLDCGSTDLERVPVPAE